MVILGALAMQLKFSTHLRLQATATLGQGMQALFLARAAVEKAVYDVATKRDGYQSPSDYLESETMAYSNVPLGEGNWTLFAGYDASDRPVYGIMDECARINVTAADASVLARLPGMTQQLAAEIVLCRQSGEIRSVNDLLRVEGIDTQLLFGEDANGNGLLDPNENDGDESWPPDNADGRLDEGIAAFLTIRSAVRNVTADGKKRVNISSASADELKAAIPNLTSEEADSIVAQRGRKAFVSIADLLDVELTIKAQPQPSLPQGGSPERGRPPSQSASEQAQPPARPAFDQNRFMEMADCVSMTSDETVQGLVNINTASARALACLEGMTDEIAAAAVSWRERRREGFKSVADLLNVEGMTVERFKTVCPYICARSDMFRARAFGVVQNGEVCRCVEAVLDRTGQEVAILDWRELD